MATDESGEMADSVIETIRRARDSMSVTRCFGEAYELDGISIIPVARVAGGAGGGGGEGTEAGESGSGYGSGFGVQARPVGVYEVRGGEVVWKPAIDVNRVARGGQVLCGIALVCLTIIRLARRGD